MLKHALLTLTLTSGVAVAASGVQDVTMLDASTQCTTDLLANECEALYQSTPGAQYYGVMTNNLNFPKGCVERDGEWGYNSGPDAGTQVSDHFLDGATTLKCAPSEVQQSDPCDACVAACGQADAGTTVLEVYSELSHCGGVSGVVHDGPEDCSYSCLAAKCTADQLEAAYPYLATKKAC